MGCGWVGNAEVKKAYSELAACLPELGRAKARMRCGVHRQALEGIGLDGNRQKYRQVLLARTAQILEAMRDSRMDDQPPAGG